MLSTLIGNHPQYHSVEQFTYGRHCMDCAIMTRPVIEPLANLPTRLRVQVELLEKHAMPMQACNEHGVHNAWHACPTMCGTFGNAFALLAIGGTLLDL